VEAGSTGMQLSIFNGKKRFIIHNIL